MKNSKRTNYLQRYYCEEAKQSARCIMEARKKESSAYDLKTKNRYATTVAIKKL